MENETEGNFKKILLTWALSAGFKGLRDVNLERQGKTVIGWGNSKQLRRGEG